MAQTFRPDRLGDQIRAEISQLLAREVHDPGVGFVTITRVQVTADLQIAKVFYTTMADEAARKQTAKALDRALPFLRRQLAARIRLRRVPELEFRFDQSVEQQDRIERLIHDIQTERAERGEDPTQDDPKPE
jgi:ribosome-binding factor A